VASAHARRAANTFGFPTVPRDRDGAGEPVIVTIRQRRLSEVDEIVCLSLYARGMTTGEISAHFAQMHGASVSKETISRIIDNVDRSR